MLVLTSGAQAVVPGVNGKVFYASGNGPGDIFSVNPDGSSPTNLTNTPSRTEERPTVDAHGQVVVFQTYDGDGWEIWKMNGDGSNVTPLTDDDSPVVNFEPGISPDGTKVVFMKQASPVQDLWEVGINGGAETDLTNTNPTDGTHSDECCAEYSPDGTKIVYVNGFNTAGHTESNDIWMMNADGTNQHSLTGPNDYPIQDVGPSFSPDGTKIVFSRMSTGTGNDGLYVMNTDGSNLTPLMDGVNHILGNNPTWSPDGMEIAFSTGSGISLVPAGGGTSPTPLVASSSEDYPSWAAAATGPPPDTTPPDTVIDSGPSGLTNSASFTSAFHSTESGSTFECRIDGGAFASCSPPASFGPLADGAHTFEVRATDAAGNTDPTPASLSFTIDTTPPDTVIDSGPSGLTNGASPSFSYHSTESGSTFECRIDGGAFASCSSPTSFGPLADGAHTFEVRATDAAANTDPTPASAVFTVDTTPPDTVIDSGPSGLTNHASFTSTFHSTEPGSTFECRIDGGAFAPCSSPKSLGPLVDGPHTFAVRATDKSGNTDASPASRSFIVDTTPPNTTITAHPSNGTASHRATFGFQSSQPGSTFRCALDGQAFAPCHSPQRYLGLAPGHHKFKVDATDPAGNADPTPATYGWRIKPHPVLVPKKHGGLGRTSAAPCPASPAPWCFPAPAPASFVADFVIA